MPAHWSRRAATLLTLLFSPLAFADDDEAEDRRPSASVIAPAPEAVRLAVTRAFPRAEIVTSAVEHSGDGEAWRLRLTDRLTTREVVVDPAGDLVAQCEDLPGSDAPDRLKRAVERQFGARSVWHARHFTAEGEEAWLLTFSRGERVGTALFDADGALVRGEFAPTLGGRPRS